MLAFYLRLTGKDRDNQNNRILGMILAFVAGAVNAGGFLAIQQYTSHMTGIVSAMADRLVLSDFKFVLAGLAALLSFLAGATTTSIFVNWARRQNLHSEYALSLSLEAVLLLIFGVLGANLNVLVSVFVPTTLIVLCFIMGLQNALMTKVSRAEIRTTHMTGIVTDLGIELGHLLYWNKSQRIPNAQKVTANHNKLMVQSLIFASFVVGATVGAYAFKARGYQMTVPLAVLLLILSVPPLLRDLCAYLTRKSLKEGSDA